MPTERPESPEQYTRLYAKAVRYSHDTNADAIAGLIRGLTPEDTEPGRHLTGRRAALADALEEAGREDEAKWVRDHTVPIRVEHRTYRVSLRDGQEAPPFYVRPFGPKDLSDLSRSYVETALWSSMDESDENTGGSPMNENYGPGDIHPATLHDMHTHVHDFYDGLPDHLKEVVDEDHWRAGHDFWLTRNGHGAGFWDGDWPNGGDELTDHSRVGEYSLHVGDDGMVHGS